MNVENMSGDRLSALFDKYSKGLISVDEMISLRRLVDESDDSSLRDLFSRCWESNDFPIAEHHEEIRHLFDRLEKKILHTGKARVRYLTILRTVAAVLIVGLCGLTTYLLVDRHKTDTIGEREMVVNVEKGQRVNLTLPDGTFVHLNSESQLIYAQNYGRHDRRVRLSGEGFFDVVQDHAKKFVVATSFMEVEVLGTSFNMYAYESKELVELTLVSGKVSLSIPSTPRQMATLSPGSKAIYNKKTGKLLIEQTNTSLETAWISSELVFRSESLSNVFEKLEKRYNTVIELSDSSLLDEQYTGLFDKEELPEVMKILSLHFDFRYKIGDYEVEITAN